MTTLTAYTLVIYKADKRIKQDQRYGRNRVGKRFVEEIDTAPTTLAAVTAVADAKRKLGLVVEVHETFVTRVNIQSGLQYQERFDTPYFCSPSRDAYWAM